MADIMVSVVYRQHNLTSQTTYKSVNTQQLKTKRPSAMILQRVDNLTNINDGYPFIRGNNELDLLDLLLSKIAQSARLLTTPLQEPEHSHCRHRMS